MSLSHTTQGVVPNGTALLGRAAWAKRTNSNNTYRVQKLSAREPLIASTIAYIFLHFLPSSREFTAEEPNFCHAAYLKTKGEERKPAADRDSLVSIAGQNLQIIRDGTASPVQIIRGGTVQIIRGFVLLSIFSRDS
ncbi:hypothetical protein OPV22_006492 [Ensete ventricosum]|uniref:Uncharacterized protein n=1 Tax=Ensete ventricosum TaxID=4639 RepID=A0AAV8RRV5_ENSVE|nr:hypothetical protein OPV22_006492 [Ensete ventricosum]